MSAEKQTVFLSGASGYIAQHTVKQLLDSGKFKVIGSVRSEEKGNSLAKNFNSPDLSFVYVKDISSETAFDDAFKQYGSEIDYVVHTASPVAFDVTDINKDLIVPAKIGSTGIFKASVKYAPNLKHFVITSSSFAILDLLRENDHSLHLNEQSWNPITYEDSLKDAVQGYCYSKKIAEQTVWKLGKELNVKFGITAINPTYVLGPQCFDSSVTSVLNVSCEFVNKLIHSKSDSEIDKTFVGPNIDVRDVARAHIEPLLNSEKFNGQRLLLSNGRFGAQSIVDILNEIPQLKGKIAVGTPHSDDDILNRMSVINNEKTKELLGFEFISLEKSIKDTASQILKVEGKL
ncbi:hypothetical protein ACO0SA_004495 [Hanseniaspora valbyensis]